MKRLLDILVQRLGAFSRIVAMRLYAAAAGFVVAMLLGRVLGPAGFGAYSFAMGWVSIAVLFTTLGFHHFTIRAIPPLTVQGRQNEICGLVIAAMVVTTVMAVLGSYLAWVFLDRNDLSLDPVMHQALILSLLLLLPLTWNHVRTGLLQGLGHPVAGQVPERLVQSTFLLVVIGVFWWTGRETSVTTVILITLAAMVAGIFAGLFPLIAALRSIWTRPIRMHPGAWIAGATKSSFLFAAASIMGATDTVMLGQLSTPTETGLYGVATRFFLLMQLPLSAAVVVVSHRAAMLYAADRQDELEDEVARAAFKGFVASLFLAVLSTFVAFNVSLVFGPGFDGAFWPILMLVWSRVFAAVLGPGTEVLGNTVFIGTASLIVAGSAIVNVVLNWLMIPGYGASGAAVATGTSFFLMGAAGWWYAGRKLNIRPNARFRVKLP